MFNCITDLDIQQIKCDAKYTNDIIVVEINEVVNASECLDVNKTCGMNGIYAEHLKLCDHHIVAFACYVCNCF